MNFLLQIRKKIDNIEMAYKNFKVSNKEISIDYHFDGRKPSDSFCKSNSDYIILVIGVLFEDEKIQNREDYYFFKIIEMYKKHDADFPNFLRGCFCGFIYDVKKMTTIVFTDHSSCRRVFYFENDKYLYFSSDISKLRSFTKFDENNLTIDINGSKMLLQNGYMLGDTTIIKNVKKLLPGTSVKYKAAKKAFNVFYDLNFLPPCDMVYSDAIDEMEKFFSRAVRREFNRDLLDQKSHLITLSGGLDSRATRIISKDLGYNKVTNITMSQSGYLDYTIALDISNRLNDDFIFFSLDNGKFLYNDILQSCKNNGGTALYNGNAHIDYMIDNINSEQFGILHTGMIGDVVAGGSYITTDRIDFSKGLYSTIKGFCDFDVNTDYINYSSQEMNLLYNRGINGAFNGLYSTQRTMEAYSPFIDPDFMYFMFSLPRDYVKDSKIYIDWMKKYHRTMLDFKWEKTSLRPSANKNIVFCSRIYKAIYRRVFKHNKKSMNPYDYWFKNKLEFKKEIEYEYNKAYTVLVENEELKTVLNELNKRDKTINKLLVISLYYSLLNLDLFYSKDVENV